MAASDYQLNSDKGGLTLQIGDEEVALDETLKLGASEKINIKEIVSWIMKSDQFQSILNNINYYSNKYFPFLNNIFIGNMTYTQVILVALIAVLVGILYNVVYDHQPSSLEGNSNGISSDEEKEEVPLRDFTLIQLREFDGSSPIEEKPIYVGIKGEVFDVTSAHEMYGKGSSYNCFAGREASRALGLLSFDEADLSNLDISDLGSFAIQSLDDWYDKFKHVKKYPIVGKVSIAPTDLQITLKDLLQYNGKQSSETLPSNRMNPPTYIGINGKIIDVSYGGYHMYGPEGSYNLFAGIDASKALAKMSFDEADLSSRDLSDLTEEQTKTLESWYQRLSSKYPVVGTIIA